MIMQYHKLALTVGLVLAMAFTFSCSDDDGGDDNNVSSSGGGDGNGGFSNSSVASCVGFVDGTKREHYGKEKEQFCDSRDGKKYVYVTIGDGATAQTWMAENLSYDPGGGLPNSNCNGDRNTYGCYYNWSTAMNGAPLDPSGVQGICPSGWHLPLKEEWEVLITAVGGKETAGKYLKATSGWNDYCDDDDCKVTKSGNGEDKFGFAALPTGISKSDLWSGSGDTGLDTLPDFDYGDWWSASEDYAYYPYRLVMYSGYKYAYWHDSDKSALFNVRCIQD